MDLGVDVTTSPDQGKLKFAIGYDREVYAVVPKRDKTDQSEAMSVTAASRVSIKGLDLIRFGHVIATGRCAVQVAQHPENLGEIVDKLFGDDKEASK
jgi:hypothetical protein